MGMFSRIGKKIKVLATVLFYITAVASVVGALYIIFTFGRAFGTWNAILLGLLTALLGVLLAWIGSFTLYGFGELVDNSTAIREALTGAAPAEQPRHHASPLNGLARAVGNVRTPRQPQNQPAAAQPQPAQAQYQPPQTTPAYAQNRPTAGYQQPNPYQRAGSYPPSQQQTPSLTGNSGWVQVDAQTVQCPRCHYALPASQARVYGGCPQCRLPFNP